MSTLSELLADLRAGRHDMQVVLKEHLLEEGLTEHEAIDFINSVWTGPAMHVPVVGNHTHFTIKPGMFYDTDTVGPFAGSDRMFFTPMNKSVGETNLTLTRRLPAGQSMQLRWLSVRAVRGDVRDLSLSFLVSQVVLLECPLDHLIARGPFGYPLPWGISHKDDLRLSLRREREATSEAVVRVELHGWVATPIW